MESYTSPLPVIGQKRPVRFDLIAKVKLVQRSDKILYLASYNIFFFSLTFTEL